MRYSKLHNLIFASLLTAYLLINPAFAIPVKAKLTPQPKLDISKNSKLRKEQKNMFYCQMMDPKRLKAPRITISNITQSSAFKGGNYSVQGVIDGVCMKEAGLYLNGERVLKFPFETIPNYKRYSFKVEVHMDDLPEIRAFDINWQRSSQMLLKGLKR